MFGLPPEHSAGCLIWKGYKIMIDSNETIVYESGRDSGYQEGYGDCKEDMKEIIESMAYEIARYRFPKQYEYNADQIKSIMSEFEYTE